MGPINMLDIRGVDLNLLVSLDTLLEQANVTRAAARLGLSQPALSAQLARLREVFQDPLLVPSETGRGMALTARALELKEPLRAALEELERIVKRPPVFDPMTAQRVFSIVANDNAVVMLGLGLLHRLRSGAGPGIRVSFQSPRSDLLPGLLERGEVDVLLGSERTIPRGMKMRKLLDERFRMAQRKGHPRGTGTLTLEEYCGLQHVLVSSVGGSFHGFMDEHLEKQGHQRTVAVSVHTYTLAPMVLEATDYVCTLPARFLAGFADRLDCFELPLTLPDFTLSAAWHPRCQEDPGHLWLREQLIEVARRNGVSPA
ncbi:LysR family transcriptional regulator [Cystobacter fuscus]|nr:LysR family transcriptional regulator [Cystobacter fuscus]